MKINVSEMFVNDTEKIINLLVFIILFICSLTSSVHVSSYISLSIFVLYVLYVILKKPDIVLKYLFLFFMFISETIGISICNLIPDMYLPELAVNTSFNGSMPLLFMAFFVLLFTVQLVDYKFGVTKEQSERINPNGFIDYVSVIVFFLFLILFLSVAKNPSFAMKVDRFEYAKLQTEQPRFITLISQFWMELIVFPIFSLVINKKKTAALPILVYCLYAFWTGNKFGPFFSIVITICLVVSPKIQLKDQKQIRLLLIPLVAAGVLLVTLAVFAMSLTVQPGQTNYLLDRTAQQSQLWWKTYGNSGGQTHVSEYSNEITAAFHADTDFSANIGSDYGIYKIMYYTTPEGIVNNKLAGGSRYTEAGYACAYYYFGYIGPIIFSVCMGFLIGLIVNGFIKAITRNDIIKAIVLIYLLTGIRTVLSMHTFNSLVDKFNAACILYILITAEIKPAFTDYSYVRLKNSNASENESINMVK